MEEKSMMKKLLTQRIKKPEEIPKYLSIKQAKLYLEKKGFLVSESELYKMTSESKILFYAVEETGITSFLTNRKNGCKNNSE